jgi:aspartyl protease family protein
MQRLYAILLLAMGLMSFVAVLFQPPADQVAVAAESAKAQGGKPMASQDESDALLLRRDSSGQFHINASLNGTDVRFLVDTGADLVALTEDDAQAMGLTVGEMQPILQTASGVGYGAPVMIDELVVAGVELRNVQAVVAQGLSTNLLGQSVLRKLGGVSLKGDRMVIHPR